MATIVPPAISERALSAAVDDFVELLGGERVVTDADGLRDWRDPFQHASWEEYVASAVVMPETVEEVQEVVRLRRRRSARPRLASRTRPSASRVACPASTSTR